MTSEPKKKREENHYSSCAIIMVLSCQTVGLLIGIFSLVTMRKVKRKRNQIRFKIVNCEKLCDAQAHAYKHIHNANTRKNRMYVSGMEWHGMERMCSPGKMRKLLTFT